MADAANSRKPRKRVTHLVAGIAIMVFFSCCGCPAYYGLTPYDGIRVRQVRADLEERLPVGSTPEQAEAWFTSHGLTKHGIDSGFGEVVTRNGRRCGFWGKIPLYSFENAWIEIYVGFDDNDRVKERSVTRGFYSL